MPELNIRKNLRVKTELQSLRQHVVVAQNGTKIKRFIPAENSTQINTRIALADDGIWIHVQNDLRLLFLLLQLLDAPSGLGKLGGGLLSLTLGILLELEHLLFELPNSITKLKSLNFRLLERLLELVSLLHDEAEALLQPLGLLQDGLLGLGLQKKSTTLSKALKLQFFTV